MSATISARGLHKRYADVAAADGVSFDVQQEDVGILGPNGAGGVLHHAAALFGHGHAGRHGQGEGPSAALPAIGILLGFTLLVGLIAVRMFRWDDI